MVEAFIPFVWSASAISETVEPFSSTATPFTQKYPPLILSLPLPVTQPLTYVKPYVSAEALEPLIFSVFPTYVQADVDAVEHA